jgi:SAM-dependent methyltransferase
MRESVSSRIDFEIQGREYDSILGEAHEYYVKAKVKLLQNLRKEINAISGTWLDVGCGTGLVEHFLHDETRHIIGIDLVESMLRIAKNRCVHCQYFRADALKIPFANNSFDLTFSIALMHHVESKDRLPLLKEISRVTKAGGYISTFEHNPANPYTRCLVAMCRFDRGVTLINPREMIGLCRRAGLVFVDLKYLIFFPRYLSFLEPLEGVLRKIPFGGQYQILAKKPMDQG